MMAKPQRRAKPGISRSEKKGGPRCNVAVFCVRDNHRKKIRSKSPTRAGFESWICQRASWHLLETRGRSCNQPSPWETGLVTSKAGDLRGLSSSRTLRPFREPPPPRNGGTEPASFRKPQTNLFGVIHYIFKLLCR